MYANRKVINQFDACQLELEHDELFHIHVKMFDEKNNEFFKQSPNTLVGNGLSCPLEHSSSHLMTEDMAGIWLQNAPGHFLEKVPGSKVIRGHISCVLRVRGHDQDWLIQNRRHSFSV